MNGLKAVEDLALYLHSSQRIKVFKFEKTIGFKGEYIVVNHLPFIFGQAVNSSNALNVNIHVPALSKGGANIPRLTEVLDVITSLIPFDNEQDEVNGLNIDNSYYSITSISQPMEDTDKTFFLNIKIKLITNQLTL